jgi:hypothetical protein
VLTAMGTDLCFTCNTRKAAAQLSKLGHQVWV